MERYHINPKTGMPSMCHASLGKCPYGGISGNDRHFGTYSMALAESQNALEDEHSLLPSDVDSIGFGLSTGEWDTYEETMTEEEGYTERDMMRELLTTNDSKLLLDVIEGRKYAQDGWDNIAMALQNPNLPKETIEEMLFIHPGSYSKEAKRHLALNSGLTQDDLNEILQNDEDVVMHALAYRNMRFDQNVISDHLRNKKELLTKVPHYFMIENASTDKSEIDSWFDWVSANNVYIETNEIQAITLKYTDWMVNYYEEN